MFHRLSRRKISRDQWTDADAVPPVYRRMMDCTWEETRVETPDYFQRLRFSVAHARGRVLEAGCGIGTMTRWLAASPRVESVTAVDAFPAAIEELAARGIPKVEARCMRLGEERFAPGTRFDTVMLCELIEHLYASEERAMLRALREVVDERTRYVVSTPVGFMPDPHHVRGFSPRGFVRHLMRNYGPPEVIDRCSGYSQVAVGEFKAR